MPSIIKNRISSMGVSSFVDKYGIGSSGERLYMSIGRDSAWSNEAVPDTPLQQLGSATNNGVATEYSLMTNAHAMVQIPLTDIQPVVPRVNWAAGQEYNALRTDISDPYLQTNYYVMNSSSQVFRCVEGYRDSDGVIQNAAVSGSVEPFIASPTLNQQFTDAGDGYVWEYLYTISGVASNSVTSDWIPVAYGSTVTGNDDPDSLNKLGGRHIIMVGQFDGTITISAGDDEFRQVGVFENPLLADGTTAASASEYQDPATEVFTGSGLTANAGRLFYHENRTVVVRNASQIEQIKIIVEF